MLLVGVRRIILTRRHEMIDSVRNAKYPMLKVMENETRYDLLNSLRDRNKSWTEIRIDLDRHDRGFAFHLNLLTEFHLMVKNERTRLYNITVKGLRALKGADMIIESEMCL